MAKLKTPVGPADHAEGPADAGVTLVESYIAAEATKAYQVHDSLIVSIGNNSRLDHVRLIEDAREAFNISSGLLTLGAHVP